MTHEPMPIHDDHALPMLGGEHGCCAPTADHAPLGAAGDRPLPADGAPAQAQGLARDADDTMIRLPGGTFRMGNGRSDGYPKDGEGPVHPITLIPFRLDRTTVTNAQYAARATSATPRC